MSEPQRGFQENIISFDANSLYPSVMITLNLSPETKFGSITYTDDTYVHVKSVNNEDYKFTKPNFIKWAQKNKIEIEYRGSLDRKDLWYVKNDQHRAWFILRWS